MVINGSIEDPLPLSKPRKKSWLTCNPGVKVRLCNNGKNWQNTAVLHFRCSPDLSQTRPLYRATPLQNVHSQMATKSVNQGASRLVIRNKNRSRVCGKISREVHWVQLIKI
jgi:hypothetical protein